MRLSLSTYGTHRIRQNTAPPKVVRAFIDGEKSGKGIQVRTGIGQSFGSRVKCTYMGTNEALVR